MDNENRWNLTYEDAAVVLAAAALVEVVDAAAAGVAVAEAAEVTVTVTGTAVQSVPVASLVFPVVPEPVLPPVETPATAASISAAVASKTIRFCEIMHPTASFASLWWKDSLGSHIATLSRPDLLAGVPLGSWVAHSPGLESPSLQRVLGVATNRSNLLRKLKCNSLVGCSRTVRRGVLMLDNSRNLRVHRRDRRAGGGFESNCAGVALESAVLEGCSHPGNVVGGFGVGECAIGGGGLQAVRVL